MIYRFDDFALDSVTYELHEASQAVAIEPQVFSLLVHLIENRQHVVSRDEMIETVWNGRIVSDATLSSAIFALRQALGDTGKAQNIIRTVPRRGFRFVSEVTLVAENSTKETIEGNSLDLKTNATLVHTVDGSSKRRLSSSQPSSQPRTNQATVLPKLAVLPFKIASAGLDEYFCDGLTEDIISNLTHFRELRVIASGSSFQFRDRTIAPTVIASKLNVDYIVDGSVRLDRGRLRIAVQLNEATSGVSIWADHYDRQMKEIFSVQDAVTHMIAASLGVKMQNAELTRSLAKSPTDFNAYDYLLHARRYTATLYEDMHATARDLLEKAIALDPNYAEAHALLANVYLAEHRFDANPRPHPIDRALKMALKAILLDPQNAYAHCWLAIIHFFQKDIEKFKAETQRALDLNPHDPEILAEVGHYLCFMGNIKRGIELSKQAQTLNPLHPGWYHFSFALMNYHEGRYEEMLGDVQRISMPDFFWTHILNAAALGQLGSKKADASLKLMQQSKPGISVAAVMRKWIVMQRDYDHIMEGLLKAGLNE